jgi:hypothetical protein
VASWSFIFVDFRPITPRTTTSAANGTANRAPNRARQERANRAGHELSEHNSPGEATLQILGGRVRLSGQSDSIEADVGDFVTILPERHALEALDDIVVLLTVVVRGMTPKDQRGRIDGF